METKDKPFNQNDIYEVNVQNIKLAGMVEKLKTENDKIPKIKDLIGKYKEETKRKDEEIEKLKNINEQLYSIIKRFPKIIRRIFIGKDEIKLLGEGK